MTIASGKHPVSIPNLEVKPFSADGTATGRSWESRTSPDIHTVKGHPHRVALNISPTSSPHPAGAGIDLLKRRTRSPGALLSAPERDPVVGALPLHAEKLWRAIHVAQPPAKG